jgi:hypothetical protein
MEAAGRLTGGWSRSSVYEALQRFEQWKSDPETATILGVIETQLAKEILNH